MKGMNKPIEIRLVAPEFLHVDPKHSSMCFA
jgi:hypothetical protein